MIAWFEQLSDREKMLISIMGALVGVLLVSLLIIRPLMGFHQSSRAALEYEKVTARFVESAVANAERQTGAEANMDAGELRRLISTEARRAGLRQGGISNNENNTVSVSFTGVSSGQLLGWLTDMERNKGIGVVEARISKARTGEAVDARLTFREISGG